MNLNLKDRNAIVCGASRGIGRAIAVELAELGASVTIIARDKNKLKEVTKELKNDGSQKHGFIAVDFSEPEKLRKSIKEHISRNPPVHILINNSGGPPAGEITRANTHKFEEAFSRHLICNQILVQLLLDGMKKEKYGRIINVISISVKQPIDNLGVSNTIRGAVASWSKTLANEVGKYGITVNNLLPGSTKTERLYSLIEGKAERENKTIKEIEDEMIDDIPAGRFGEPQELAYAAAFLASPSASYINGINLAVDGGRICCL